MLKALFDSFGSAPILALLNWVGFTATIGGLWIAIRQMKKVKTSTEASSAAIKRLTATVHSRERLLDLSSALRHLDAVKLHIGHREYSKASIFLELARGECVQVSELMLADDSQKKKIAGAILRMTRLLEGLLDDHAQGLSERTSAQRSSEARRALDIITVVLAGLRFSYPTNGHDS